MVKKLGWIILIFIIGIGFITNGSITVNGKESSKDYKELKTLYEKGAKIFLQGKSIFKEIIVEEKAKNSAQYSNDYSFNVTYENIKKRLALVSMDALIDSGVSLDSHDNEIIIDFGSFLKGDIGAQYYIEHYGEYLDKFKEGHSPFVKEMMPIIMDVAIYNMKYGQNEEFTSMINHFYLYFYKLAMER